MITKTAVHSGLNEETRSELLNAIGEAESAESYLGNAHCRPDSDIMKEFASRGIEVKFDAWKDKAGYVNHAQVCKGCPEFVPCRIRAYTTRVSHGDITGYWAGLGHTEISDDVKVMIKLRSKHSGATLDRELEKMHRVPKAIKTLMKYQVIRKNES